jgi:hypothetical protein
MSNAPGLLVGGMLQAFQTVLSSNLAGHDNQLIGGPALCFQAPLLGTRATSSPSQVSWFTQGALQGLFGDLWFDRIIVLPRQADLGAVLSPRVWNTEVWSTFRDRQVPLTGIAITGPGGLQVTGPSSMIYSPGQSQLYSLRLETAGDPSIDTQATWVFTGVAGTDLAVTGSRVAVFPFRPDWSEPFLETPGWLTEILPAYDATEQRRSLRQRPRYSLAYRVATTDPLETASLEALLYGWQARQFGVPMWPEATALLAAIMPGDTALSADTTDRPAFAPGGLVMVWSGHATWEVFQVTAVLPGSISLGSQVTKAWSAGARVVPIRRGRLQDDQALGRPTNWLSSGAFAFTCEPT